MSVTRRGRSAFSGDSYVAPGTLTFARSGDGSRIGEGTSEKLVGEAASLNLHWPTLVVCWLPPGAARTENVTNAHAHNRNATAALHLTDLLLIEGMEKEKRIIYYELATLGGTETQHTVLVFTWP